jgi:hypothetical protein
MGFLKFNELKDGFVNLKCHLFSKSDFDLFIKGLGFYKG